jgi:predicted nucleotidyltransferase component of viral defense system
MLRLAKEVQECFPSFYLAGGTALMFRYQHRVSDDLDFFSQKPFSFLRLSGKLKKNFDVEAEQQFTDNIDFRINGIKVSFVFYPFSNQQKIQFFEGIKVCSDYDIFLNKIYVAGRRIDSKDPFDAAYLYNRYQWNNAQIKKDFEQKFPNQDYQIHLGAILNFSDYPSLPVWVKTTLPRLL